MTKQDKSHQVCLSSRPPVSKEEGEVFSTRLQGPGREASVGSAQAGLAPEAAPRCLGSEHPMPGSVQAERVEAGFADLSSLPA